MGAGSTKGPYINQVEDKYGIKSEKLYYVDGCLYYKPERSEFKLHKNVLKSFENFNKFSKDNEDTPIQPIQHVFQTNV
jgi:hypothetical protein